MSFTSCSCKATLINSKEYLLLNNPNLVTKYEILAPTSIDSQKYTEYYIYRSIKNLLNNIELNIDNYTNDENIYSVITKLKENNIKMYNERLSILDKIKSNYIMPNDDVFIYQMKIDNKIIWNLMYIKNGKIIGDLPDYYGGIIDVKR